MSMQSPKDQFTVTEFKIGDLDLGGATNSDIGKFNNRLRDPGTYNFVIKSHKFHINPKQRDAAGKQWGSLQLNVETVNAAGYKSEMIGFVPVPLETVMYTGKSGKTTPVRTNIFCSFIEALTGERPGLQSVKAAVTSLPEILKASAAFTATVAYDSDHVEYQGKVDNETRYAIKLADGSYLLDNNGLVYNATSVTAAKEFYEQAKGRKIQDSMIFKSFARPAAN